MKCEGCCLQTRGHDSVEEERSDSLSVYSSVSQGSRGSHDFDSVSVQSGSLISAPFSSGLQSQFKNQLEKAHTIAAGRSMTRPPVGSDTYDPPGRPTRSVSITGRCYLSPLFNISITNLVTVL